MVLVYDPSVWGPHYWFFLHTVAESYPLHPTNITKRKYYDLLMNMPLFIPNVEIGNKLSEMLDAYPPQPYLDNRESFVRWVHFLHNKVNVLIGKDEISLLTALEKYRDEYRPRPVILTEMWNVQRHYLYGALIVAMLMAIFFLL